MIENSNDEHHLQLAHRLQWSSWSIPTYPRPETAQGTSFLQHCLPESQTWSLGVLEAIRNCGSKPFPLITNPNVEEEEGLVIVNSKWDMGTINYGHHAMFSSPQTWLYCRITVRQQTSNAMPTSNLIPSFIYKCVNSVCTTHIVFQVTPYDLTIVLDFMLVR